MAKKYYSQIRPFPKDIPCHICGGFNLSGDGGMGIMCYDCGIHVFNWGSRSIDLKDPYPGFDPADAWDKELVDDGHEEELKL